MGFKPVPYQNLCVHHILQIMLEKVLHIHSRTSLCCLDSCWYQSFSCWERWQLHRITIKLPLQIDPFCPCLCCFLASHRGHYPTLSLFGSYIRSFSHFPCHFMIESWGWSLSTLSWRDFLKSRVFQPDWLYTAQEDVSDHRKIAKILLSSLLDVVRRNYRVILQYLVNACMLVDWRESIWSLSPAIFSRNGPSSDKVSSLPIKSYLTGQGWKIFRIDANDDRAIYFFFLGVQALSYTLYTMHSLCTKTLFWHGGILGSGLNWKGYQ